MHLLKRSMNREVKKKMTRYKNSTKVKTRGKKGWQLDVLHVFPSKCMQMDRNQLDG